MGIWDDQVGSETFPAALAQDGPLAKAMQWLTGPNGGLANTMGMRPWYEQSPMDIAMGFAPSVGVGAVRAYHGSPHNFDKFDMSNIGTGEGAQAYGHGLYFAGNERVARSYRDALSPPPKFGDQVGNAADLVKRFGNEDDALRVLQSALVRNPSLKVEIDAIKSGSYKDWKPAGRMYEVDINANPAHLLDWDRPLSQQSEKVRGALRQLTDVFPSVKRDVLPGMEPAGSHVYGGLAKAITPNMETGMRGAATELREAGIPGIRYLDQGSRGAGEGSHNYVMFDDKLIDIIRKYGLAGLAVPGALAPYAASQGDY